jgi:hypothetical protein
LDSYRSQIREGMLKHIVEESVKEELNQKALDLISKSDLSGLYE